MMDSTLQILLDDGWQPCVHVKFSQINGTPGAPGNLTIAKHALFFKGV